MDKSDFGGGTGLPPKTYAMTAGMQIGVRPILPPKVRDSEEKFHPAARELADIHDANLAGSSTPTPRVIGEDEVDAKGIEFDKKTLSPAAFEKFEEARATVKTIPIGMNAALRRVNGDDVRVIPLGTSSALPSKYRNGMPPVSFVWRESDDCKFPYF